MQQHVHLGDGPNSAVELLPEQVGFTSIFTVFVDVFLGGDQHAARAAAGVVDVVIELGFDQPHHHPHHRAWCVELATFLAR
ncbi:hypothetical protein D3C80_1766440 [compost metagenome]